MAFKRKPISQMRGTFDPAQFVKIGEAVLKNEKLASFIEYLTSTKRNREDIKREAKDCVYDADFGRWATTHGDDPDAFQATEKRVSAENDTPKW